MMVILLKSHSGEKVADTSLLPEVVFGGESDESFTEGGLSLSGAGVVSIAFSLSVVALGMGGPGRVVSPQTSMLS